METKAFNKGDFVKYCTYNGAYEDRFSFGIFEGIDLAPEYQYTKKYSLAAFYDSYKYTPNLNNSGKYGYAPFLEVSKNGSDCEKTIDTINEDTWWKLCSESEKNKAIEILRDYGFEWDEELLSLIDMETGEIVHRIVIPKIEYNGDTIKPICNEFKSKLKESVKSKNKTTTTTAYNYYNDYYREYDYD